MVICLLKLATLLSAFALPAVRSSLSQPVLAAGTFELAAPPFRHRRIALAAFVATLHINAVWVLTLLASPSAAALEPLGHGAAVGEAHVAIEMLEATANRLPAETRQALGADIAMLVASVKATLSRLEQHPVPIVDHTVPHDLQFVADIVQSVTDELEMFRVSGTIEIDQAASRRIDQLATVTATRLDQIDGAVDQWVEENKVALIRIEDKGEVVVVHSLSRLVYNGVRYASITLISIGLLVVAVLLRVGKDQSGIYESFIYRSSFWSKLMMVVFFVACLVPAVLPGLLAGLSAQSEVYAAEHPCQRLRTQRHQLGVAQRLDSSDLIELTKQRMQVTAADCLGVAEAAAASAVERLAVKGASTHVTRSSLPPGDPGSTAAHRTQVAEKVREAQSDSEALAGKVPQHGGVTQTPMTALQSIKQEPEAELVSTKNGQNSHDQLEVYLHFADPNDRDLVEGLGNALREEGYEILGVQLVEEMLTAGDIRYRHKDQKVLAEHIRTISYDYLNDNLTDEPISLEILDIGERYSNLPRNRIELWLPQL